MTTATQIITVLSDDPVQALVDRRALVRVYRNLRNKLLSVVDVSTGRVVFHTDKVGLGAVKFIVRPAGNRRVRETGQKCVHAFVRGQLMRSTPDTSGMKIASYNPFKARTFYLKDTMEPVYEAETAVVTARGEIFVPRER
jgi:hypothetical protein